MENEIRVMIRTIYGKLWDLLSLYEETECFNCVPKGADEDDIWDYIGNRLLEIRKEVNQSFLGEKPLREKLLRIVDETEVFVRSYEQPGVVERWKKINPQIIFFDCAFDIREQCPEEYRKAMAGMSGYELALYPYEALAEKRKNYFAELEEKIEKGNLKYSEERIFMDELLRTLTMVFEEDFKEYWADGSYTTNR